MDTDYLVIGAGALGMGFVDTLLEHCDAEVVMVDRRHGPGGHWRDAYPFVQLHQPSMNYGVNSTPLGRNRVEPDGRDAGFYERASGPEICSYYDDVMRHRFLASGRVRFFPMCDYLGDRRFRSRLTGAETEVTVRRRVVDATYMASRVPGTDAPPFAVADGARCIAVGELTKATAPPDRYVIIGAGKTAMDAVVWLLDNGTPPDAIRWIRPREPWMLNRAFFQPGDGILRTFAGIVSELEAVVESESIEEVFDQLERRDVVVRLDPSIEASMLKGATVSLGELDQLRRVTGVVRLGHVTRIDSERILLEEGSVPTGPRHLHVHSRVPRPERQSTPADLHRRHDPAPADHACEPQPLGRAPRCRRSVGTAGGGEEPALPPEHVVRHALRLDAAPVDGDENRAGVARGPRRPSVAGRLAPEPDEGPRSEPGQRRGGRSAGPVLDGAVPGPRTTRGVDDDRYAGRAGPDLRDRVVTRDRVVVGGASLIGAGMAGQVAGLGHPGPAGPVARVAGSRRRRRPGPEAPPPCTAPWGGGRRGRSGSAAWRCGG